MAFSNTEIRAEDLTPLTLYHWECTSPKGIIHLVHGMSEHAARYDHFASWLNENGYSVIASDLRGHGKTAGSIKNVGHFATKNGWEKVVNDLILISNKIKEDHPNLPIYLMGHSMGSFLVRSLAYTDSAIGNGYILSSTAGHPGFLGVAGEQLALINTKLMGKRNRSWLLTKLAFGDFNKKYKEKRTEKDWLSRDESIVNQYINDPYCMQTFTSQFYTDLTRGLLDINQQNKIDKMDKNKPILLFAGDMDPVGNYGKGPEEVAKKMKLAGITDLETTIYKDGRHEMLNELNKEEVYQLILNWLNKKTEQ
jgi:alpha-beta hydrolase superfamily lysophospholipase